MLEGVLVDLVPFDARFEAQMLAWLNGPLRVWWGMSGLISRAARERWLAEWATAPEGERARSIRFGMLTRDAVPIGTFLLADIDPVHRQAEVGAGIGDPAYWGGGFGSDGMLLVVDYAFEWLGLRRLWLGTRADNVRARRQVEKCGYTLEGMCRHQEFYDGQFYDMALYGLLREEWPGRPEMVARLGLRDKAKARGFV